jgi:hypothetical protein
MVGQSHPPFTVIRLIGTQKLSCAERDSKCNQPGQVRPAAFFSDVFGYVCHLGPISIIRSPTVPPDCSSGIEVQQACRGVSFRPM